MDPHLIQMLQSTIKCRILNRRCKEPPPPSEKLYRYLSFGRGCIRVPIVVYLALVFQAITTSQSVTFIQAIGHETEWKATSPQRQLSGDIIVLSNGSTTSISSLEEYLTQLEQLNSNQTVYNTTLNETLPSPIPSSTTEAITSTSTSIAMVKTDEHKAAALFQLEREETTTTPSTHPTTQKLEQPTPTPKQAEIRHHEDKHHHGGHHEHSTGNTTGPKPIPQHYQISKSLLNVTHDYPLTYSRLIYGYIWPMMAAITLFTNLMIVFVLTQRDMRSPTNVVLTAIAIADIIPIVVPVPWFVYLFSMGNEKQVLYPPVACYFYQHLTRSVSEIFYFLSTWLNVLLAVQDYLTACLPHLAKKYCQLRVVVIQIVTLTLLAFSLNLPQALKIVFKPVKFYYNGQLTWGCRALQARWFKDLIGDYAPLYDDIFAAIIVIFVDGGPAAALITLTALLIRQLQKQRIQGHLLMEQARTASKRRRERHRQQEYESSARVMIFVLLASLAVKIPFATTYTMMIIQSRFDIHFVENLVDFQTAITITDLAFVLSYPINFTIFCCCSKKFRHKCVQLLGECTHTTKSARNRFMSSFSVSLNSSTSQIYKRASVGTIASQVAAANATVDGPSVKERAESEPWPESHLSSTKNSALSTSSLDDRHPLVLERLCDGRHHLQWLHPGDRPPRFRALLSDGSQCQECMARHEDLWASRERRQSADSTGNWPLPPPPPPLHMHHYRLPQIVTTRCESIQEQSLDETTGEEGIAAAAAGEESTRSHPSWTQHTWTQDDSYVTSDEEAYHHHPVEYKNVKRSQETQQEQIDRHELHDSETDDESCKRYEDKRLGLEAQSQAHSNRGSNSSFVSLKLLKNMMMRRLSSGQEDRQSSHRDDHSASESLKDRGHQKDTMDDKHSSLSLSNSKLTTLPNATGQLADILMSTLFMPGSSGGGGGGGRSPSSEPAFHRTRSERSRVKDGRRSHG